MALLIRSYAISGLQSLYGKNLVDGFLLHNSPQDFKWEACIKAKMESKSRPKMSTPHERKLGELTLGIQMCPVQIMILHVVY